MRDVTQFRWVRFANLHSWSFDSRVPVCGHKFASVAAHRGRAHKSLFLSARSKRQSLSRNGRGQPGAPSLETRTLLSNWLIVLSRSRLNYLPQDAKPSEST